MIILYAALVFSLVVIFLVQILMYRRYFYWRRSFQGRALMGQMVSLYLLILFTAGITILRLLDIDRGPMWQVIAIVLFSGLAYSGIRFCFAIYNSREKIPRAK